MNVTQTRFAEEIGVSQQQISKYIKSGILSKVNNKGELDYQKSIDALKKMGKIDESGKFIKRDKNVEGQKSLLPIDGDVDYPTLADLTPEEIEQLKERERKAAKEALFKLEEKAKEVGRTLTEDQKKFIEDTDFIEAKRQREAADALSASINVQLKEIEVGKRKREEELEAGLYVLQSEVDTNARKAGADVLAALESSINRMAPRLLKKDSIHAIKAIMREEFKISMRGLLQ